MVKLAPLPVAIQSSLVANAVTQLDLDNAINMVHTWRTIVRSALALGSLFVRRRKGRGPYHGNHSTASETAGQPGPFGCMRWQKKFFQEGRPCNAIPHWLSSCARSASLLRRTNIHFSNRSGTPLCFVLRNGEGEGEEGDIYFGSKAFGNAPDAR